MPYIYPSSIQEMIEMGLLGIAMSRYSGCWVGMKVITETVETTAEIDLTDEMKPFIIPTDFEMPPGAARTWHHAGSRRQDRFAALQDRHALAAGAGRCAAIRRRPRGDLHRRGAARDCREPGQAGAVQLAR